MKPKQLYLILLVAIILIILFGLGFYYQGQKKLTESIGQLQRLSGDIQLETEQISRLQKLEADYRKIEPLALKAASVLPAQKQQADVVAQIAAIARNNGLELSGLTFETTKGLPDERSQTQASSIGGILIMPVRFTSTSSYSQLLSLLEDFERQQRFMRVATLEVTRDETGKISANFTLEVFLKP